MQEHSDKLGDKIEGAGEDWEHRKADDGVPGATGEPSEPTRTTARTATAIGAATARSSTSAARSPTTTDDS